MHISRTNDFNQYQSLTIEIARLIPVQILRRSFSTPDMELPIVLERRRPALGVKCSSEQWAEEKSDWSTWSPTLTLYPSQGWVLGVFLTFRCVLLAKGKKHCEHRMGSSYQHRCWGQMGRESSVLDLVAAEVRVKTFHALKSSWSNVGWLDSANNAVPA